MGNRERKERKKKTYEKILNKFSNLLMKPENQYLQKFVFLIWKLNIFDPLTIRILLNIFQNQDSEMKELMEREEVDVKELVGILQEQINLMIPSFEERVNEMSRYNKYTRSNFKTIKINKKILKENIFQVDLLFK